MVLTGPNCAGTISPGKTLLGIMPGHICPQGNVGIVGRSGTFGRVAAAQMNELGIGSDPINGSSFKVILEQFENDEDTEVISITGAVDAPDQLAVAELTFRLRNLVFPKPGEYRFQLWSNTAYLGERRFVVKQMR